LRDNGEIPNDNPFVDVSNAKTAVYSYGHRNPQGMTKHKKRRSFWLSDCV
jgi:glucose/arabinose dehydrogenase